MWILFEWLLEGIVWLVKLLFKVALGWIGRARLHFMKKAITVKAGQVSADMPGSYPCLLISIDIDTKTDARFNIRWLAVNIKHGAWDVGRLLLQGGIDDVPEKLGRKKDTSVHITFYPPLFFWLVLTQTSKVIVGGQLLIDSLWGSTKIEFFEQALEIRECAKVTRKFKDQLETYLPRQTQ